MSRECPDRYNDYKYQNPGKKNEIQWSSESLDEQFRQLLSLDTQNKNLWFIHSRMDDLKSNIPSNSTCDAFLIGTKHIADIVKPKDGLLVAETIIGRQALQDRSGLIFFAMKLNRKNSTVEFTKIAHSLLGRANRYWVQKFRSKQSMSALSAVLNDIGISV